MNSQVDLYLQEGCGRCPLYQTQDCKVHSWTEELIELRRIVLECGLTEEYKWSQPCYTFDGKNVLIVTAFKEYAALAFFKGVLLNDAEKLLITPGKSSQAARQIRFTNLQDIIEKESQIKGYVLAAIEVEKAGLQVEFKKNPEPIPEELLAKFEEIPSLKVAFESLTPGRQRGYILFFSQPKKSKTRSARIARSMDNIFLGKGIHDR